MYCVFCRTSHPPGARFCWHCGSSLAPDQAAWSNQKVLSPTPIPTSNYHQQQLQYQAQSPPPPPPAVQYQGPNLAQQSTQSQGQAAPQPQPIQYQGQASSQQQAIQYQGLTSPQQQSTQYQGQALAQQPTQSQGPISPQPQVAQYQGQVAPQQQPPQYQGQTSPPPQYQGQAAPPQIQYQSQPQQSQAGQQQLTLQQYANNTNLQDQKGPGPQIVKAEESSLLLGPKGEMLPGLERFARLVFDKLDQTVAPKNTGCLEPSKFTAYRRLCGLDVPAFYEKSILPYFTAVGIETVVRAPNQKPGVTFFGYKTLLRHKIMVDPDVAYVTWSKGMKALGITEIVLKREDFPPLSFPQAVNKENKIFADFKAEANRDAKAIGTIASIFFGLN